MSIVDIDSLNRARKLIHECLAKELKVEFTAIYEVTKASGDEYKLTTQVFDLIYLNKLVGTKAMVIDFNTSPRFYH